jgi:membrane-bound ClpP family serine protease
MQSFFGQLNATEIFFLICAFVGGLMFLIRTIMMFSGISDDVHTDISLDHGDAMHADADTSFKLLTLHGITAFLMMFGLVGFALYWRGFMGTFVAMIGGSAAGLATVWVIGKMFQAAMRMQSSGTVNTNSAIGSEGTVYLTIPPEGTGSVQINIKNRLREFDAVSHTKEQLKTGERIRVVWVNGNTLVVEKMKQS